jgi:hypothetical protein
MSKSELEILSRTTRWLCSNDGTGRDRSARLLAKLVVGLVMTSESLVLYVFWR